MTQVNKTITPSMREQHQATTEFRSSLESLMVAGRAFLAKPSMEDSDAVAFTTLTEDVLEPAGLGEELSKIDGVTDPASKVELIMQDIIQPQLTTVAKLEEHLAEKAAGEAEQPFTTRDQMTAGPSLESLELYAAEITTYQQGLASLKQMASMEGISADLMRPVAIHFIKQVPDITQALTISVEDLESTQVLGDLTDAVDRITQVVDNAREIAETKVSDARNEASQATGADDGSDLGTKLSDKARGEDKSGVKVDEGVNVSSTSNDGNAPPVDNDSSAAADAAIDADANASTKAAAGSREDTNTNNIEGGGNGTDDAPADGSPAPEGTEGAGAGDEDFDLSEPGAFIIEKTEDEEAAALAEAEAAAGGDDTSGDDTGAGDDTDVKEEGAFTIEKTDEELAAEKEEEEAAKKAAGDVEEEEEEEEK